MYLAGTQWYWLIAMVTQLTVTAHAAIVCEGWCYPEGVCVSTDTQCGCNNSMVVYSTCAHRLQPDLEADCTGKCHNDGTCILHNGLSMCVCPNSYYGNTCQFVRTGSCSTQLCLNGGTCIDEFIVPSYCLCKKGYYGNRCEEPEVTYFDESARHPQRLSAGNIAAIVVIVFTTIGLSVGVRYFRKWKIQRLRRNRQSHNTVLNNRQYIGSSSHSGVNFVQVPDVSPLHSPSPVLQLSPIPSSYSYASTTGLLTVNPPQSDMGVLVTNGEMPPPYTPIVDHNMTSKSNMTGLQQLNCSSLEET
uniref:Neurogenic locus protein delta-like n=1 Tax=Saccoglossus kowalevskii TaxID=10224 RepID=A0ABM0MCS2_SACKO|nr:PREDICTED: neurogenic locus protein delta-like [Saccoglossus kowalevskii]